ncbi:MAG: preprotein translocase subunit SecG [Candidatus Liptonbacteria bacterium]|nr:preprotein translocase subunit SecG [Candidatus Liptonbacteria bacterium]
MALALIQTIVSVFIIGLILLQERSSGLSGIFGGDGSYQTRRGMEKRIFQATVALVILFVILSIIGLLFV